MSARKERKMETEAKANSRHCFFGENGRPLTLTFGDYLFLNTSKTPQQNLQVIMIQDDFKKLTFYTYTVVNSHLTKQFKKQILCHFLFCPF